MTDNETHAQDPQRGRTGWCARGHEGQRDTASKGDVSTLRELLEAAKQDVLYAKAETQNVRRRLGKDIADARYAATGFARDILSVADNLARALGSIPAGCARMTSSRTW
jgi:molecular chaperone GrpE